MNRKIWSIVFILFAFFRVGTVFSQSFLDGSISNIVSNLSQNLNQGDSVAVLNIEAPTKELSDYIIDELSVGLINRNIRVMERKNLEALEQELKFSMSGSVSDETAQRIGHYIGVKIIISGSFSSFGNDYRLRVQATSVETAQIINARVETISDDNTLTRLLGDNNPKNAWKNRRVYIGIWPGFGASIFENSDQFKFISYGIFLSFQFSDLLAIGVEGNGAYFIGDEYRGRNDIFAGAFARLTLRPSNFEVDVFIGPAFGEFFGFYGGVEAGINAGPGVVFIDARLNSWLGYSIGLGYQIGFGNRKGKK
jgi:hypothetical protein